MLKSELLEIIANGENSGVEFKRDDIRPEQLAKEVVALANFLGGRILLGVEDDGAVSGIQRPNLEEWVMNVFRDRVHPMLLPFYEEIQVEQGIRVAVISFPQGIAKPYVVRHSGSEEIFVRMGTTSRLATREQQARLFSAGSLLHTELLPVAGTDFRTLDRVRFTDYLRNVLNDPEIPGEEDQSAWEVRAEGLGLMVRTEQQPAMCTIAGVVLFGINPRKYVRTSGLRVMAFEGVEKDYDARLDTTLDGPLVGRWEQSSNGRNLVDNGLLERFMDVISPFISKTAPEPNAQLRRDKLWFYPIEAMREVVLNALTHRDWTRNVDVEVVAYADRLEVVSPGALPNSMTIEKMKAGQRSPRNTIIVEIMRDYGYVDARGMGVRRKIIPLMRERNHSEPRFDATDDYLRVTLPRSQNNLSEVGDSPDTNSVRQTQP